jgi:1,4-dihydroxy-2-naphthoyl-CoA hydrolase
VVDGRQRELPARQVQCCIRKRQERPPRLSILPDTNRGTQTAVTDFTSRENLGGFVTAAGLVLDEITPTLDHHTPWGIVHGGVYSSAVESAASLGASVAVRDRGLAAVGLVNTTHFLRSVSSGRVLVEATPINQGRTQQLWKVDITTEEGRIVAHGEVRLQNVEPR